MKWFKHYSDNHRGRSVQFLLDELGYFGPFFYYLIYEMASEKLEQMPDKDLDNADCKFIFNLNLICSQARCKTTKVILSLNLGKLCGLWNYTLVEKEVVLEIPILLELLDRRRRRASDKRPTADPKRSLELELELDKEKKILKEKNARPAKPAAQVSFDFEKVYEKYPRKIGKTRGIKICEKEIKTLLDYENLLKAVSNYATTCQQTESKFIKHFSTFMGEWRDWIESVPASGFEHVERDWDYVFGRKENPDA